MLRYEDVIERKYYKQEFKRISHLECDKCGKKISPSRCDDGKSEYVYVHTWHNDWGNDSIESHCYYDLCIDCASKFVSNYIMNSTGSEELKLSRKWLSETATGHDGLVPVTKEDINLES